MGNYHGQKFQENRFFPVFYVAILDFSHGCFFCFSSTDFFEGNIQYSFVFGDQRSKD